MPIFTVWRTSIYNEAVIVEAENEDEACLKAENDEYEDILDIEWCRLYGVPDDWEVEEIEEVEREVRED